MDIEFDPEKDRTNVAKHGVSLSRATELTEIVRSIDGMAEEIPVVFDDENPEWTEADFARARPIGEFPQLATAFAKSRGPQHAPVKRQVTIRLDEDILAKFRATGRGWQSRINAALKAATP